MTAEMGETAVAAGFGALSTTDEVLAGIDLTGKTVLVTGVSAGLGVETARVLSAHGARVIGTARDVEKARRALDAVGAKAEVVQMDLASLASIRAATDILAPLGPYDVVIANAGVMACPQGVTEDGFETQFGTNHLGHFVFVNRLAGQIKPGGRMVVLSSAGHRYADVSLDDPGFANSTYAPFVAYGRSKTANALFALEFDRRWQGRGIRAMSVHPGGIQTELSRHMTPETLAGLIANVNAAEPAGAPAFKYKTIPQGAATTVWAGFVADPTAAGGRFCEDCHIAEPTAADDKARRGVRPYAQDPDRAKALWTLSEQMVGETF